MNGVTIPRTPIAVDHWKTTPPHSARVFFLSHMHEDHIKGLTPTWCEKIHCSPITKRLLIMKFKFDPNMIVELEPGTTHHLSFTDSETSSFSMSVTVLDANHCPGAVMFIFQSYFGKIFHTGDFRYSAKILESVSQDMYADVDVLYLDNTFCSPVCNFPTRDILTEEIIEIIAKNRKSKIWIGIRKLGKEDLLTEIAKVYQCYVYVTDEKMKIINELDLHDYFTTESDVTNIEAVPMHRITSSCMQARKDTVAILPTALYIENPNAFVRCPNVYVVRYSDHSSYNELQEFVSRVKPRSIVPVVRADARGLFGRSVASRADMSCFDAHRNQDPARKFDVPDVVRNFMERRISFQKVPKIQKRHSFPKPAPRRQPLKKFCFDACTPDKSQENPQKLPQPSQSLSKAVEISVEQNEENEENEESPVPERQTETSSLAERVKEETSPMLKHNSRKRSVVIAQCCVHPNCEINVKKRFRYSVIKRKPENNPNTSTT